MNALPIHSILFNDSEFKVYGTHEEPLFLVNDIVCDLLGLEKINKDWFFQSNKTNSKYVVKMSPEEMGQNFTPISRYHKTTYIYFFTELGLYRCLMRSNKPIAELFQDEVVQLLKNIRLGVIGLQILKEEEYKQQIQQSEQIVVDLQSHLKSAQEQISKQSDLIRRGTKHCTIYRQVVKDKTTGEVKGVYAGSTTNPERRDRQHRNRSCNPGLRKAIANEQDVVFETVCTFSYIDDEDRKAKERAAILQIDQGLRLNVQLPRVRSQATRPLERDIPVKQSDIEEAKVSVNNSNDLSDSLSTIRETESITTGEPIVLSLLNQRTKTGKYFGHFSKSVQELAAFIKSRRAYPQKRSTDESEARLARFVDTVRQQLNNPKCKSDMPQERRDYLFATIPDFIQDEKEYHFTQTVRQLAGFIQTHRRYPVGKKGDTASDEARLAKFLAHLRESRKAVSASHRLTPERVLLIDNLIPGFEWNEDNWFELRDAIDKIKAFQAANNRLPRTNQNQSKTVPEEEIKLGFRLHNIRTSLRAQTIKPEVARAKREFISNYAPDMLQAFGVHD